MATPPYPPATPARPLSPAGRNGQIRVIAAGRKAAFEAGVRAWQLEQAASAPDAKVRANFTDYAASTLDRQRDAEQNRNWLLAVAIVGAGGGIVLLLTSGRRTAAVPELAAVPQLVATGAAAAAPGIAQPPAQFRPCQACQWQISAQATACPRCGHPNAAAAPAAAPPVSTATAEPPRPINKIQRAFYVALLVLGLGSAVVIYTVLFDDLSETVLTQIAPYWIFPSVFGYYGLVAQRMEARMSTTHLDNVSDQLLTVIKEIGGPLGQAFAFLVHAPFLIVKSARPWVTAFVGSLIWAIALVIFFEVIFPEL